MATTQASRRLGFDDAIIIIIIIIIREGVSNLYNIFTHGSDRGIVEWRDETASTLAS